MHAGTRYAVRCEKVAVQEASVSSARPLKGIEVSIQNTRKRLQWQNVKRKSKAQMQRYCFTTKFSLLLCNDTFTNHSHSEKQHQHHTRWQLHLIMTVNDYQQLYENIQAKYVQANKRIGELKEEVGSLYQDLESMERSFGTYTGKKKRDAFDAANEPLIGEVLDQVFRRYKFLPLTKFLGFTPEDPRSVCGRIKKVVVLGGGSSPRHFTGEELSGLLSTRLWLWGQGLER